MSKEKLISIIVPCYNSERYLNCCVDSILRQKTNRFEIILINDGSTDKTLEICKKYQDKHNDIKVESICNGGVSVARNRGLEIASGEYVMFVDSDDFLLDNSLQNICDECENNRELIIFDLLEVDEHGESIKNNIIFHRHEHAISKDIIQKEIITGYKMNSVCNKVFNRSLISKNKLKFNSQIHYGEDLLFVMNYCTFIEVAYYINKSLYCYRKNALSATHIFNAQKCLSFYVNERMYDFIESWGQNTKDNIELLNIRTANIIYQSVITPFMVVNVYNENIYKFIKSLRKNSFVNKFLNSIKLANYNLKIKLVLYMLKKKNIILLFIILKIYSFLDKKIKNGVISKRARNEKKKNID